MYKASTKKFKVTSDTQPQECMLNKIIAQSAAHVLHL